MIEQPFSLPEFLTPYIKDANKTEMQNLTTRWHNVSLSYGKESSNLQGVLRKIANIFKWIIGQSDWQLAVKATAKLIKMPTEDSHQDTRIWGEKLLRRFINEKMAENKPELPQIKETTPEQETSTETKSAELDNSNPLPAGGTEPPADELEPKLPEQIKEAPPTQETSTETTSAELDNPNALTAGETEPPAEELKPELPEKIKEAPPTQETSTETKSAELDNPNALTAGETEPPSEEATDNKSVSLGEKTAEKLAENNVSSAEKEMDSKAIEITDTNPISLDKTSIIEKNTTEIEEKDIKFIVAIYQENPDFAQQLANSVNMHTELKLLQDVHEKAIPDFKQKLVKFPMTSTNIAGFYKAWQDPARLFHKTDRLGVLVQFCLFLLEESLDEKGRQSLKSVIEVFCFHKLIKVFKTRIDNHIHGEILYHNFYLNLMLEYETPLQLSVLDSLAKKRLFLPYLVQKNGLQLKTLQNLQILEKYKLDEEVKTYFKYQTSKAFFPKGLMQFLCEADLANLSGLKSRFSQIAKQHLYAEMKKYKTVNITK